MRRAIGEAEHQEGMRAALGDECGEFPIDRSVGDMEYVADQVDIAKRWTAQLRQPLDQRHRRVERRAGKRAEAGDEDAQRYRSIWPSPSLVMPANRSGLPPAG